MKLGWLVSILGLCTVSCTSMTPKGEEVAVQQDVARDVNEEIKVGREVAAKLLGYLGEHGDPNAREYLSLVGHTLVRKVGRPELTYRFAILHSDEFNAYACPGGYIFVTKGLLEQVENESELAGVLAHEIAHVNEKHMYNEIAPRRQISAGETISRMMSRGGSDLGRSISQMVNKGLKLLLEEGLGKEKELAADEAGMLYSATAGYNPASLQKLLRRMESKHERLKLGKGSIPFSDRIGRMETLLGPNGLEDKLVADTKVLEDRFQQSLVQYKTSSSQK